MTKYVICFSIIFSVLDSFTVHAALATISAKSPRYFSILRTSVSVTAAELIMRPPGRQNFLCLIPAWNLTFCGGNQADAQRTSWFFILVKRVHSC